MYSTDRTFHLAALTADYRLFVNPAYNQDGGPAGVLGSRVFLPVLNAFAAAPILPAD
jgi:hypothetical protein